MQSLLATVAEPRAAFQISWGGFDVGSSDLEQVEFVIVAPGDELAEVQLVRVSGQAAIAGKEPSQREPSGSAKAESNRTTAIDDLLVKGVPPESAETRGHSGSRPSVGTHDGTLPGPEAEAAFGASRS